MFTVVFAGNGTCGKQKVPGYGFLLGPTICVTDVMGNDMFWGPLSGPSVPNPRFM